MLLPDGRSNDHTNDAHGSVFQLLGGELAAVDTWTRVDFSWMHEGAAETRDAVGYRGITMPFRVAGLTLGDADAAPMCPPFLVEIWPDRLSAQVFWHRGDASSSHIGESDAAALQHWSAGSLTKDLRVVRFGDGDPGLEAELHLTTPPTLAAIREFVTAFSWDVAALHAFEVSGSLLTTEEWIRRAALSISRSTPRIPLREHQAAEWNALESPPGVFCRLQPGGGLCESDNVLYAVRRDANSLLPMATMPGHRSEWDYTRLIDVFLARDGVACFARSLLCEGLVNTGDGVWRTVDTDAVTAIAGWGDGGFLLGMHDGQIATLDGAQTLSASRQLAAVTGRFTALVSHGDHAVGLIGTTLVGARLGRDEAGALTVMDRWSRELVSDMSFDLVSGLDADRWSSLPSLALLGDDGIAIIDSVTGATRSHFPVELARQARWIGAGWLLVLDSVNDEADVKTRCRVLDVLSGRWTEPVVTDEVSRIAVRGDEIHVGYANQSIAVWDRGDVCRGIGTSVFRSPVPEGRSQDGGAETPSDAPVVDGHTTS